MQEGLGKYETVTLPFSVLQRLVKSSQGWTLHLRRLEDKLEHGRSFLEP